MEAIATRFEKLPGMRTTSGQHDLFPDTDSVAGEPHGLGFWNGQPALRRDPLGNRRLSIAVECGG